MKSKSRFPLLEQLRAQYQTQEDELTAPYKHEIERGAAMIASLGRRLMAIEAAVGTEAVKMMLESMAHQMTGKLMELAYKAAAKARAPGDFITLTVPLEVVCFADHTTVEAEIVRQYQREALPKLSLSIDEISQETASMTVIDIRVPPLAYRQMIQKH